MKYLNERKADLNIGETTYDAPADYKGAHYDHFYNFFQGIRGQQKIVEDRYSDYVQLVPHFWLMKATIRLNRYIGNPDTMKLV